MNTKIYDSSLRIYITLKRILTLDSFSSYTRVFFAWYHLVYCSQDDKPNGDTRWNVYPYSHRKARQSHKKLWKAICEQRRVSIWVSSCSQRSHLDKTWDYLRHTRAKPNQTAQERNRAVYSHWIWSNHSNLSRPPILNKLACWWYVTNASRHRLWKILQASIRDRLQRNRMNKRYCNPRKNKRLENFNELILEWFYYWNTRTMLKVIPFRTMEWCVQIPQWEIWEVLSCKDCKDDICRQVSDNVRVLVTRHLVYDDFRSPTK